MTIFDHVLRRLTKPTEYTASTEELKTITFEGIQTYIFNKVTSGKFRKTSLDQESIQNIKSAIHLNVSKNQPIKFTYPFGGYKSWRLNSFPNVDWAEFMTISYVLRYIAPIATTYQPGVEIFFSSDDVVIELIDNYPRKDLDLYVYSFRKLLSFFSPYVPKNVTLSLQQVVPDIYTPEEYHAELERIFSQMKHEGFPQERARALHNEGFAFNFLRNGKQDLTNEDDYERVFPDLAIYSDAYLKLEKRKAFVRGKDKIVLFSNKIPNAIDIGSTNVSKAKFWACTRVFEKDERYHDRILSPTQWDQIEKQISYEESDLIQMDNFSKIPVIEERLNFKG